MNEQREDELLRVSQAAREVGLSRARIQQAISTGQLKAEKQLGLWWGIWRSDLFAWFNNPDYHKVGQPRKTNP